MKLEDYIPLIEQQRVVEAIAAAERSTSGEIKVHITPKCGRDVLKAARRMFNRLNMFSTKHRNAVLIFLAFDSKRFAIIGDTAIDEAVPDGYWDEERDTLRRYLSEGLPADGLVEVIGHLGEKLKLFFPAEEDDENEISNEISFEE